MLRSSMCQKVLLSSSVFVTYLKKSVALVSTCQLMVSKQEIWEGDVSG